MQTRFLQRSVLVSLLAGVGAATAVASSVAPPPPTPVGNAVDTYHGVRVTDPYRWLENAADPKVKQ